MQEAPASDYTKMGYTKTDVLIQQGLALAPLAPLALAFTGFLWRDLWPRFFFEWRWMCVSPPIWWPTFSMEPEFNKMPFGSFCFNKRTAVMWIEKTMQNPWFCSRFPIFFNNLMILSGRNYCIFDQWFVASGDLAWSDQHKSGTMRDFSHQKHHKWLVHHEIHVVLDFTSLGPQRILCIQAFAWLPPAQRLRDTWKRRQRPRSTCTKCLQVGTLGPCLVVHPT